MAPMRGRQLRLLTILAMAVVLGLPITTWVQAFKRGDLFTGLSFGVGRTSLSPPDFVWTDSTFPNGLKLPKQDDRAFTMELSLGAMTTERLAIVCGLDVPGANVRDVPGRLWNLHLHGGVRNWITRKVWIEGGLGPTLTNVAVGKDKEQITSEKWGFGLVGGAGYDLVQMSNGLSAHVQARASTNAAGGVRTNSIAVLFGGAVRPY